MPGDVVVEGRRRSHGKRTKILMKISNRTHADAFFFFVHGRRHGAHNKALELEC